MCSLVPCWRARRGLLSGLEQIARDHCPNRRRERIDCLIIFWLQNGPSVRIGQAVVEIPPLCLAKLEHDRKARGGDLVGALLSLEVVPDARPESPLRPRARC